MRKLMIASLSFTAGTALCHYLLPLPLLLWLAAIAAAVGIFFCLRKGEAGLFVRIVSFSIAIAFVYNFAYISLVRQAVERWVAEERMVEAIVLDYCEPTARRWRIPVQVQGERSLKAMYYGGAALQEWMPGDELSGLMTVQDASSINDTPLTSFTAKGYYLMLYPKGDVALQDGQSSIRFLPQRIAGRMLETIDDLYQAYDIV